MAVGGEWYWIVTRFPYPDGKLVIIGPKQTEEEANEFGFQKLDSPFEIHALQTRDRGRATSQLKAKLLDSTSNLGTALQHAQHQTPSERAASMASRRSFSAGDGISPSSGQSGPTEGVY